MSKPILAWVTRHPPTPRQRRDFADYRIVPVRYRHGSWQFLYEDILFECRGVPDAIMLTWRNDVRQYAIRYINQRAPYTLVLRTLTEADDLTPTGLYVAQRWIEGVGLVTDEWTPKGVTA